VCFNCWGVGHCDGPLDMQSQVPRNVELRSIPHLQALTARLAQHKVRSQRKGWLRALVLGASDGLVSTAALLMGMSAATSDRHAFLLAGAAGLVGGALSMGSGEYVSVSTQRDTERADVQQEIDAQNAGPESQRDELEELRDIYVSRGLDPEMAMQVAKRFTEVDVIGAHARDEYGIDMDKLANAGQAAIASSLSFAVGACIPLLSAAFIPSHNGRMLACTLSTIAGLIVLGSMGAKLGGATMWRGALRVFIGGVIALGVTYTIGLALQHWAHLAPSPD
jgi:VIT1/CCC1 family predicted Fe2+/Mn2+ transporter